MAKRSAELPITRRAAILCLASGAASIAFPSTVNAEETGLSSKQLSEGQKALGLWKEAEKQAKLEGSVIQYGLMGDVPIKRELYVTGKTNDIIVSFKGLVSTVHGAAAYDAASNGNIIRFYDGNIEAGSGMTVQWCHCKGTIIDSGQTLAASYSCSLYWPRNIISCTASFYAEFWGDGSGYIKGGPV